MSRGGRCGCISSMRVGVRLPSLLAESGLQSVLASSRVNPLPQESWGCQTCADPCGSGFTRERAGTG
ncbi:hypothetical protein FCH83_18695 [Pseudomonas putida]|nr:hypothetical protein [Pseudomonas putida]NTY99533.1 hypothetical protein [Pseudomonas putida]NTZ65542.1 hypothetical protein [Pseudomonas putida]NUA02793.1 hypothetical protein [Pseudomonas putida]NUA05652.1 hypothetical protein [Pseudomonas putida]